RCAARPTTWILSGKRSATASALCPTEPVAPRITTRRGAPGAEVRAASAPGSGRKSLTGVLAFDPLGSRSMGRHWMEPRAVGLGPGSHDQAADDIVDRRRGKENGIEPIEDPPVPGDDHDRRRVLAFNVALQQGLDQIADLTGGGGQESEERPGPGRHRSDEPGTGRQPQEAPPRQPAAFTLPPLLRALP